MAAKRYALGNDRSLVISALGAHPNNLIHRPFATLLPAFNSSDRKEALAMANSLIDSGCVEFCCGGPEAEELHDALDQIIEGRAALEVVTTWDPAPADACDYFLIAAAGGRTNLLALVSGHPEVEAILEQQAQG